MIARPSSRILEALVSLEHHGRFQDVVEWLEESLADTSAGLMTERDEVELRRMQGSAKDLSDIISTVRDAREMINK